MLGAVSSSTPLCFSPPTRFNLDKGISYPTHTLTYPHSFSLFTPPSLHLSLSKKQLHFFPQPASSSSSFSAVNAEYIEEPATRVKFPTSLSFPGCTDSLTLFGTGYREKVFAIIGVKVYAAGLYLNQSIVTDLSAWKGKSKDVLQANSSLFNTIFQSPLEKSLQIILVRDVDGKTFWDALSDAISPRIAKPTAADETALTTFRSVFQDRSLKKGTFIFLTWLNPSKLLVSVSSEGVPSSVDATIESANVTRALFDVFLGDKPVSPSLKSSAAESLSKVLE